MTQPRDRTTVPDGTTVAEDRTVARGQTIGSDRPFDGMPTQTAVVETVEPTNRPLTWGPIWAGVLTAFGLFILFSLIAIAAGLALVEFGQPGGGIDGDVPVNLIALILTGVLMVVAFFAGGFVASWSGWETDEGRGILNGFLVWASALVLLLVFAALGLGQWLGALGSVFAGQFAPGQVVPPDTNFEQVGEAFTEAAWQSVLAIVLAMVAAVLGGLVGTRDEFHEKFPYYRSR